MFVSMSDTTQSMIKAELPWCCVCKRFAERVEVLPNSAVLIRLKYICHGDIEIHEIALSSLLELGPDGRSAIFQMLPKLVFVSQAHPSPGLTITSTGIEINGSSAPALQADHLAAILESPTPTRTGIPPNLASALGLPRLKDDSWKGSLNDASHVKMAISIFSKWASDENIPIDQIHKVADRINAAAEKLGVTERITIPLESEGAALSGTVSDLPFWMKGLKDSMPTVGPAQLDASPKPKRMYRLKE